VADLRDADFLFLTEESLSRPRLESNPTADRKPAITHHWPDPGRGPARAKTPKPTACAAAAVRGSGPRPKPTRAGSGPSSRPGPNPPGSLRQSGRFRIDLNRRRPTVRRRGSPRSDAPLHGRQSPQAVRPQLPVCVISTNNSLKSYGDASSRPAGLEDRLAAATQRLRRDGLSALAGAYRQQKPPSDPRSRLGIRGRSVSPRAAQEFCSRLSGKRCGRLMSAAAPLVAVHRLTVGAAERHRRPGMLPELRRPALRAGKRGDLG
jgi:hypothetical protein